MQGVWCSQTDSLCEMLGINHVFLNLLTLNIKEIERKLFEYTENLWLERLTKFPKLRTYTRLKNKYTLKKIMFFHLHYRNKKDLLLLNLDVESFPSGWKLVAFAMNIYMNGFASFVKIIVLKMRNTAL